MSIVDEIVKDKKLEDVVYFLAERMIQKAKEHAKARFKKEHIDITTDQWIVLNKVSEHDGVSQVEIANNTFKDPAAITRILDLLVKKKLIKRRLKMADRRAFSIHLTEDGVNMVNRATPLIQEMRSLGLEGLTDFEKTVLKTALRKMFGNLS